MQHSEQYYLFYNYNTRKPLSVQTPSQNQNPVNNRQTTKILNRGIYLNSYESKTNKFQLTNTSKSNFQDSQYKPLGTLSTNCDKQVITINNHTFVKSKSPPKILTCQQVEVSDPKLFNFEKSRQLIESSEQIQAKKKDELITVYRQNKKLTSLLQKQKRRQSQLKNSIYTPIKNLNGQSQLSLTQHQYRIVDLKNKILELQKSLQQAQFMNSSLQRNNQILKESVKSNIRNSAYLKESIIVGNVPELRKTQNEQELQKYILSLQEQILKMENQAKLAKISLLQKNQSIQIKDQQLQKLRGIIRQMQAELQTERLNSTQLKQIIIKLEEQMQKMNNSRSQGDNIHKINIPIRYGESQSLNQEDIKQKTLMNVSLGYSILINEDKQLRTKEKNSALDQDQNITSGSKQRNESIQIDEINESGQQISQYKQEDLIDILKNMQLLMQTNQKVSTQNKILVQRLKIVQKQNKNLQDTLQYALQRTYLPKEGQGIKLNQKSDIYSRLSKSKDENVIELQISESVIGSSQIECKKCVEMAKIIENITSQFGVIQNFSVTF